jgi:hypothetical protein
MAFPGSFPQGINPWYVGMLFPGWAAQLLYDDSTPQVPHYVDLTALAGSDITLLIQPVDSNGNPSGAPSVGAGTVSITTAAQGKITYTVSASDVFVITAGYYALQWKVNMSGNKPWFSDPFILQTKVVE